MFFGRGAPPDGAAAPLLPTHEREAAARRTPPPPHAVAVALAGADDGCGALPAAAPPPALWTQALALAPALRAHRGAYLRVTPAGAVEAFAADRHSVATRYAVPPRDLRLLEPQLAGARRAARRGAARVRSARARAAA
jgi:hypothetical protein